MGAFFRPVPPGATVPDYLVWTAGTTVRVTALTPGLASFSGSTSDAAPAIQQAVNALQAGSGGAIMFRSPLTFASQLVIYPNIALMGSGAFGYLDSGVGPFGPVINTTFNGSAILVTGDGRVSTFPYLANFELAGSHAYGSQNGIEINTSGGTVRDVFIDNVFIDNMGQHGLVLGGSGGTGIKVHAWRLYVEICLGNGLDGSSATSPNTIDLTDCYVQANSGWGFVTPTNQFATKIVGGRFTSNTLGAVSIPSSVTQLSITGGTLFDTNGDSTHPQIVCAAAANASARVIISGCNFNSTAVTNHISLAASNAVIASITGNGFYGSTGDAIVWTTRSNNRIYISNNVGYNDVRGKVTNWSSGTTPGQIGAQGAGTALVASTDYTIEGTAVWLNSTAGTGVSISIKDNNGNVLTSGGATFSGVIPAGYKINFGAFSVAPTVVVSVV